MKLAPSATPVWIALGVAYVLFFSWYTSFGGPLRPEEIDHYLAVLSRANPDPEQLAVWREFMESDTGDDFAMLNTIDLFEEPRTVAGLPEPMPAADVLALYTRPFLGRALRDAAHPVLFGRAAAPALDVWGIEGARIWDQGGLVRYRSRRDLMEQAIYMAGLDTNIHAYKIAAMRKTIAYPLDPWFQLGDPRLLLGLVLLVVGLGWQLRCTSVRARSRG